MSLRPPLVRKIPRDVPASMIFDEFPGFRVSLGFRIWEPRRGVLGFEGFGAHGASTHVAKPRQSSEPVYMGMTYICHLMLGPPAC